MRLMPKTNEKGQFFILEAQSHIAQQQQPIARIMESKLNKFLMIFIPSQWTVTYVGRNITN